MMHFFDLKSKFFFTIKIRKQDQLFHVLVSILCSAYIFNFLFYSSIKALIVIYIILASLV